MSQTATAMPKALTSMRTAIIAIALLVSAGVAHADAFGTAQSIPLPRENAWTWDGYFPDHGTGHHHDSFHTQEACETAGRKAVKEYGPLAPGESQPTFVCSSNNEEPKPKRADIPLPRERPLLGTFYLTASLGRLDGKDIRPFHVHFSNMDTWQRSGRTDEADDGSYQTIPECIAGAAQLDAESRQQYGSYIHAWACTDFADGPFAEGGPFAGPKQALDHVGRALPGMEDICLFDDRLIACHLLGDFYPIATVATPATKLVADALPGMEVCSVPSSTTTVSLCECLRGPGRCRSLPPRVTQSAPPDGSHLFDFFNDPDFKRAAQGYGQGGLPFGSIAAPGNDWRQPVAPAQAVAAAVPTRTWGLWVIHGRPADSPSSIFATREECEAEGKKLLPDLKAYARAMAGDGPAIYGPRYYWCKPTLP